MTLDSEEQRKFLLELFQQVNFPGAYLDRAYETKKAIETAEVKTEK